MQIRKKLGMGVSRLPAPGNIKCSCRSRGILSISRHSQNDGKEGEEVFHGDAGKSEAAKEGRRLENVFNLYHNSI